jgi:heterodisulfide reductase subunit C2
MSIRTLTPDFADSLTEAMAEAHVASCLQCRKCSNGCPVAGRVDIKPHELVRLIQLGQREEVLSSRMIWECTSCHTCVTRCPMKVDIAALNDKLRRVSQAEGQVTSTTTVTVFNEIFLNSVRKRGRVFEPGLMTFYKLRTRRFFEDMGKLPMMLTKRKLPLLPRTVPGGVQRQEMFKRAARAAGEGKTR